MKKKNAIIQNIKRVLIEFSAQYKLDDDNPHRALCGCR